MVKGLNKFVEHFKGYEETYILIGGTACDQQFRQKGIDFRTTADLDIILIAEALTPEFVERFWGFIKAGEYAIAQTSEGKQCFFRFHKPQEEGFPSMLELFSRVPDVILIKEGMHLTPIPADEDVDSLSAILMDDDYYTLVRNHSENIDGVHVASEKALVCLKAKAFLDLSERKNEGEKIDSKNIKKHRSDIIKLMVTMSRQTIELPETIAKDLGQFIIKMREEKPEIKDVLAQIGIKNIPLEEILNLMQQIFQLPDNSAVNSAQMAQQ